MDSLKLFTKRLDLSPQRRMLLAYVLNYQKRHGQVTELGAKYGVSRTFLYDNAKKYASLSEKSDFAIENRSEAIVSCQKKILRLRLYGHCSIEAIQTILAQEGAIYDSVGYISEYLHKAGLAVGQDLDICTGQKPYELIFASDELFAGRQAILITVEPISLAILRIELVERRTSDAWQTHWQMLKNQGVTPYLLAKDEGVALKCAQAAEFPKVSVQSDTFHGVSHRLGLWVSRLEKKAFQLMLELEEKEQLFERSKTAATAQKRLDTYLKLYKKVEQATNLYHNFVFLYHNLLQCFQAFDKKGELKKVENVVADFQAALDLGNQLNHDAIKNEFKTIETLILTLFTFLDPTAQSLKELQEKLGNTINTPQLQAFCSAWQYNKAKIKAKTTQRKNKAKDKEISILKQLKNELINHNYTDYQAIKEMIYHQLDHGVQSSAAVENINSLLRPFLNAIKNQVTQQTLNLFMFFHNNRVFKHGKRKGKSPLSMLTGQDQNDVIDLILQKMAA